MITLRELEYVNGWARKVPYPGIEYAEKTAEKLVMPMKILIIFIRIKNMILLLRQVNKYYLKY